MNAISQKRRLNEAFKRFQRLPVWPMAEPSVIGAMQFMQKGEDSEEHPSHLGGVVRDSVRPTHPHFQPGAALLRNRSV